MTWTFYPDDNTSRPRRRKKRKEQSWIAPEHARLAQAMARDYPRDDLNRPLPGKPKELVVDPRPTIMVPEPEKKIAWK